MFYQSTDQYFDPNKKVIKLTIRVNTEHYPDFPTVLYVSEFNFDRAISSLMGLDYSVKERLKLDDNQYYKTWIAWGVECQHLTNPKFFGINGDTFIYRWRS